MVEFSLRITLEFSLSDHASFKIVSYHHEFNAVRVYLPPSLITYLSFMADSGYIVVF